MLHILPRSLEQYDPLKDPMKQISRMLILFLNGIFIGLTFLTPAWGRLAPYDGIPNFLKSKGGEKLMYTAIPTPTAFPNWSKK
jgi:hypothetical protein